MYPAGSLLAEVIESYPGFELTDHEATGEAGDGSLAHPPTVPTGGVTRGGRWYRRGRAIVLTLDEDDGREVAEDQEVSMARKGLAGRFDAIKKANAAKYPVRANTGMPAEKVCWIQNVLNQAEGEALAPDGIYGPLTRASVQRFQTRYGLAADGIVGPRTETALTQTALNRIASASLVPVSGVMDAGTRREVSRFQAENGLTVDGIVGPRTRAAMVAALGGQCHIRRPAQRQPQPQGPSPGTGWTRGCNGTKFEYLLQECERTYQRCLATCGLDALIEQLKQIPELVECAKLGRFSRYGRMAIILCALDRGGKQVIDRIIEANACADTCSANRGTCNFNAGSDSNCRSDPRAGRP